MICDDGMLLRFKWYETAEKVKPTGKIPPPSAEYHERLFEYQEHLRTCAECRGQLLYMKSKYGKETTKNETEISNNNATSEPSEDEDGKDPGVRNPV